MVRLVSEVKSIQAGTPFYLGLQLRHGEGYHTYWKFPGVVGVPTSINWYLPEGFTAGEIEWPAPERVFMHKIGAQGFERDVILPVKITPPAQLTNVSVKIEGRSGWMSCAKRCHPGYTSVAIELPVRAAAPEPDAKLASLFAAERARVARSSDAWKATAVERGTNLVLTIRPTDSRARKISASEATNVVFFSTDGWVRSDVEHRAALSSDGALTFHLSVSDIYLGTNPPVLLHAILRNEAGWLAGETLDSLEVAPPIVR